MNDETSGTTALSGLRARMAAASATLHLDVALPRYSPAVILRFKPVSHAEALRLNADTAGDTTRGAVIKGHARLLGLHTIGIWARDGAGADVSLLNDQPVDPDADELPTFSSPELQDALGAATMSDAVTALIQTDGDTIAMSMQLQEWSGQQGTEVVTRERRVLGE